MSDCLTMFEYCMAMEHAMQSWNISDYLPLFTDKHDFNSYIKIEFQDHKEKNKRHTYNNPYEFNICILKQLFFIISSFITSPNESYQHNLSLTVLKCIELQHHINDFPFDIIKNIIVSTYLHGISWDIDYHHNSLKNNDDLSKVKDYAHFVNNPHNYFKYQLRNSLLIYPNDNLIDSLHIPTTFTLNNHNNNIRKQEQYIFHICVQKKGDEMWIGFTDKTKFESSCHCNSKLKEDSIVYYGGRESKIDALNNGISEKLKKSIGHRGCKCSLHNDCVGLIFYKQDRLHTNLQSFRSGDWISIVIDHNINNQTFISFYQNGDLICNDINITETVNKSMMGLVLFSIVDSSNDAIYIEQAFNKNGLNMPKHFRKPVIAEKLPQPSVRPQTIPSRILVIDRATGRALGYLVPTGNNANNGGTSVNTTTSTNGISSNGSGVLNIQSVQSRVNGVGQNNLMNRNVENNIDGNDKSLWENICECVKVLCTCCSETENVQRNPRRYERMET